MNKLSQSEKTKILLTVFVEKNKSVNIIRDRIQTISIWIAGLLFAGGAFIIQFNLGIENRLIIGISASILIGYIRFLYFRDLKKGFDGQRRVLATVEEELELFKNLYPSDWKKSGTKEGKGNFFQTNYYLLELALLLFIAAIFFQYFILL